MSSGGRYLGDTTSIMSEQSTYQATSGDIPDSISSSGELKSEENKLLSSPLQSAHNEKKSDGNNYPINKWAYCFILIFTFIAMVISVIALSSVSSRLLKTEFDEKMSKLQATMDQLEQYFEEIQTNVSLAFKASDTWKECPTITFHLPRDNQSEDYVRYRGFVPRMEEATVCAWVETTDYDEGFATIASYFVRNITHNAYLLGITRGNRLQIEIAKFKKTFSQQLEKHKKFHFCQWFSTHQETFGLYIDGKDVFSKYYDGAAIERGGDLVLGQDQDGADGKWLDAKQALQGNITNFMIWPRKLSETEIISIVHSCTCPRDYSVAMTTDRADLFGEAYYSIPHVCPIFPKV